MTDFSINAILIAKHCRSYARIIVDHCADSRVHGRLEPLYWLKVFDLNWICCRQLINVVFVEIAVSYHHTL